MKITFVLDKQTIRRTDSNTVVAGSRDYLYAHFALASPDWIAPITAIFGNKTVILNDDGDCKVPWEVIEHPGEFSVSAFCVSVHTAQGVMVPVEETPYDPGETPPDPSPDVYTQLTQMVQEALDTANSVREDANAGEFNGAPGPVGPYYEPDVSDAGDISWENNGGLPNPPTKNIKGPKGDAATIEIAGTETGDPGTDASVVNEGTKGDAKFRFRIPRGDEGKAATIEVGTVTASEPGSDPQVTNSGTKNAAVLDFVLPRGQTGPTGQAATVEVESTITGQPGTQASVENVGTSGAAKLRFTIPQGAQGVPGQDAPYPQMTVGEVETVSPDTPADAEITGHSPNFVLDLKIPQGETGQTPNITMQVTGLEYDQEPTVSKSGTPEEPVYTLGIPQGQPGQDGVQINDEAVNTTEAWSSKKIVDTLCPPFTETGNPVTCNPVEDYPLGVTVTMEPIQEGEGDPSPDNVRPISGRDSVQVTRCGKNLLRLTDRIEQSKPDDFQDTSESAKYPVGENYFYVGVASSGYWEPSYIAEYHIAENSVSVKAYHPGYGIGMCVKIVPGASYVVRKDGDDTNAIISALVTKKDGLISRFTVLTTQYNSNKFTAQTGEEWAIIIFRPNPSALVTYENPRLELGSTPTPYEPYQGNDYTLTMPETIYGGTVDAVTGVGSNEWNAIAFSGEETWKILNKYIYLNGATDKPANKNPGIGYCSHFIFNYLFSGDNIFISEQIVYLGALLSAKYTIESWKSYLAAQYAAGTPVTVCYKPATPEPFQATGNQPIPALAGENTVYTDGGEVTVSGRTNPLTTIQTMQAQITALQDQVTQGGTT